MGESAAVTAKAVALEEALKPCTEHDEEVVILKAQLTACSSIEEWNVCIAAVKKLYSGLPFFWQKKISESGFMRAKLKELRAATDAA